MYLLRLVTNDSHNLPIIDSWHEHETIEGVIDHIITVDFETYQVFEADEVTSEVYKELRDRREMDAKRDRMREYLKLKAEFDPE